MSNASNEIQNNCKNYISSACFAAQATLPVLMEFFEHKNINRIDHSQQDTILIEITFETATLTCLFDENEMSTGAFLFFDHTPNIIHCIDYCNQSFPYDFFLQSWQTINCCIKVHTINKISCLAILPVASEQSKDITT